MYDKNVLRLCVDVTMTALYAALMFGAGTGLLFHELAGLAIALLFAFHFGLNFRMMRRLGTSPRSPLSVALLISDLFLPVGLVITIGTGALISRFVLASSLSGNSLLYAIHKVSAWSVALVMAFHLALHMRFVAGVFRGMLRRLRQKGVVRALTSSAAGLLVLAVLFSRVYAVFDQADNTALYTPSVTASASGNEDASLSGDTPTEPETTTPAGSTATKKEDEQTQSHTTADDADVPTLDEYLSKLFCTGCHRHCCLLTPACGIGQQNASQAQVEYVQTYGNGA
ncbi:MAG: cytochrome b/b6 domain-containing protein [Clostridiaceae bacterium]|nr:cytochrome b/b6 domain-containing protein [Clostridiaceae bacterium]